MHASVSLTSYVCTCVCICRYNAHLKDAKKIGVKKGASTGLAIATTSFFLFFVHAVGFWFGAYLIQYQDATIGDVLAVSHYFIPCARHVIIIHVGVHSTANWCVFSWPSCSLFAGLLSATWSSRIHI